MHHSKYFWTKLQIDCFLSHSSYLQLTIVKEWRYLTATVRKTSVLIYIFRFHPPPFVRLLFPCLFQKHQDFSVTVEVCDCIVVHFLFYFSSFIFLFSEGGGTTRNEVFIYVTESFVRTRNRSIFVFHFARCLVNPFDARVHSTLFI